MNRRLDAQAEMMCVAVQPGNRITSMSQDHLAGSSFEDALADPLAGLLEEALLLLVVVGGGGGSAIGDLCINLGHDVTAGCRRTPSMHRAADRSVGRLTLVSVGGLAIRVAVLALRVLAEVGIEAGTDGPVLLSGLLDDAQAQGRNAGGAVGTRERGAAAVTAGGGEGSGGAVVQRRRARETTDGRAAVIANKAEVGVGEVPGRAVGAEVALGFPTLDAQLVRAVAKVGGGRAGAQEVIPAVPAGQDGDVELGDAHCG